MVEPYEIATYKIGSDRFDEYYRTQFGEIIKTDAEFKQFLETLYDKLPVTFRLNSAEPNISKVSNMLSDGGFVRHYTEQALQQQQNSKINQQTAENEEMKDGEQVEG